MSSIDTYGELELPEESTKIEVVEDPIRFVTSCYDKFHVIFEKISRHFPTSGQFNQLKEASYSACEAFFADKQLKFNEAQIKKVLELLDKEEYDLFHPVYLKNGIFLSALQNMCIDKLIVDNVNHFYKLGYKLKKNKWLVIGKNVASIQEGVSTKNVGFVGAESEGNIINNSDHIYHFGYWGRCGIYINNGIVKNSFGEESKKGIFINNKQTSRFGNGARNEGLYINNNQTDVFLSHEEQGTSINNGNVAYEFPWSGREIISIENQTLKDRVNLPNLKPLSHLKQKLEEKLKQIEFTKELNKLSYEDQIKQAESFDWKSFEQEIKAIAEEIKEKYEALNSK